MTTNTAKEIKDFLRKDNDSWYGHILDGRELGDTKTLHESWFNDKELVRKERSKEVVKIMKQKRKDKK
jgi:hypothetical protein